MFFILYIIKRLFNLKFTCYNYIQIVISLNKTKTSVDSSEFVDKTKYGLPNGQQLVQRAKKKKHFSCQA